MVIASVRLLLFTTVSACAVGAGVQAQAPPGPPTTPGAQSAPGALRLPTVQRMLEPGAEVQQLAREVGTWDVTMSIRPTAEATPVVVSGMVAERSMVGLYLNVQARWE